MNRKEVQQVLSNWIAEALSQEGKLPSNVDPAAWIAERFLAWWQSQSDDELLALETALCGLGNELERLGGWQNPELSEALHELAHARDALSIMREASAIEEDEN